MSLARVTLAMSLSPCNRVIDIPPRTHLGNATGPFLFIMCCILEAAVEEEEAHCAGKSPAAFIKTGLCAEANDPREINDSIK